MRHDLGGGAAARALRHEPNGGVVHIGSFSKSIGPALRVGYIVAPWEMMSRILPLKPDAGSGALEQMVLAEYCAPHFTEHYRTEARIAPQARHPEGGAERAIRHLGEFEDPRGGIFLWVKLPDHVDTLKLYQAALAAGVAINPGPEWSTDKVYAGSRLRLCFASPHMSRSAKASPSSPRCAGGNSACRRASPMWRLAPATDLRGVRHSCPTDGISLRVVSPGIAQR